MARQSQVWRYAPLIPVLGGSRSLSLGQPELHSETLSQLTKQQKDYMDNSELCLQIVESVGV